MRLTDTIIDRNVSDRDRLAGIAGRSTVRVVCMATKCNKRTGKLYQLAGGEAWACCPAHATAAITARKGKR